MKALLKRFDYDDKQTLGDLIVFNERNGIEFTCKTLELAWKDNERRVSCIPEAEYTVVKRNSPKYGDHFHILDVPNRDFILVHHGNFHSDILGCVLVGNNHIDIDGDGYKDVTSSKNTMKKLNEILPEEFTLRIEKA